MTPEHCPSCDKELRALRDYPLVEIKSVDSIPLPEKILHWRSVFFETGPEIDITEEIQRALNSDHVQEYLGSLRQKSGVVIKPKDLSPQFEEDREFREFFRIPDSHYFIAIRTDNNTENSAKIMIFGRGRNYGAGGGPTLRKYAEIAKISFKGKLLTPSQP